jgi:hypothetical protein
MEIPTGDYLIEMLNPNGEPINGVCYTSASYTDATVRARPLAEAHGVNRWRIMRCMMNSSDKENWHDDTNALT